ncbi:MAG: tryptophan synthase subunit alpha [Candidatus Hydrothermarchaeales archaeon]
MSRIGKKFMELKGRREGALIGYLTLGDPDISSSQKLLGCLCEGVDILELGIPFSDPIADGPTIQAAMDRALKNGMNTDKAFEIVEGLRKKGVKTPLVFMTYYNIVLQYGEEKFVKRCRDTGVDGLLVSDLPIEESERFVKICERHDIDPIFLIAPTTPEERMEQIIAQARGFVYLISLLGVTGEREKLQEQTIKVVKKALQFTGALPLAVGFGISKREHVRTIIEAGAQGVVVGSAFVNLVAKHGADACGELKRLSRELKEGTVRHGDHR